MPTPVMTRPRRPLQRHEMLMKKPIPYKSDVLIGEWFHERYHSADSGSGILPGLMATRCAHNDSVYRYDFGRELRTMEQKNDEFAGRRLRGFRNALHSKKVSIPIRDSQQFLSNFTSTNDYYFRIKPKQEKRINLRLTKKVHDDIMKSHGNFTQFGLREFLYCSGDRGLPLVETTYTSSYQWRK